MRRLLLVGTLALALPAAAFAKGAMQATIEGPGIDRPIVVKYGQGLMPALGRLGEASGLYSVLFDLTARPTVARHLVSKLGPRYTVRWVIPNARGSNVIRQDLYPNARPFPVTYTKPGQPFFGRERIPGGWYASTAKLRLALIELGVPVRRGVRASA